MKKSQVIKLLAGIGLVLLFSGCATEQIANRCLTYTTSGDTSVSWAPIEYYQSESMLYIEIPKTANYIPSLEIIDTEFDQRYKVDYSFDNKTYKFKVKDNFAKYLLYRDSYDEITHNRVYITCNHSI